MTIRLFENFRDAAERVEPAEPLEVVLRIVDGATGETIHCSDPDFQPRFGDIVVRLAPDHRSTLDLQPLFEALVAPALAEDARQAGQARQAEDPLLAARRRLGLL